MFGQHMMPGSTMASSGMPFDYAQQQHQQMEQQRLLLQQRQQEQQQQQQLYQQLYQQQHQQQQQHEQQLARLLAASADHRNQEQIQQQQYRQQLQDLFQRQQMLQQHQIQQTQQRQMAPAAQPAADPAAAQDEGDIRTIFQDSNQLSPEHRAEILEFLRGGCALLRAPADLSGQGYGSSLSAFVSSQSHLLCPHDSARLQGPEAIPYARGVCVRFTEAGKGGACGVRRTKRCVYPNPPPSFLSFPPAGKTAQQARATSVSTYLKSTLN
jgi:chemotaxis protein histidine kinase CheA